MMPPSVGPIAGPTIIPMPNSAAASVCWFFGKLSNRIACDVAMSAPPPIPWTTRQTTSSVSELDCPQSHEASVNSRIDPTK